MDREKDIKNLVIPASGSRLTALLTGAIDGAILPPPFNVEAEEEGVQTVSLRGRCIRRRYHRVEHAYRQVERQSGSDQKDDSRAVEKPFISQKQQGRIRQDDLRLAENGCVGCHCVL